MICGSGTCMVVAGAICLALSAPMHRAAADATPAASAKLVSSGVPSPDAISTRAPVPGVTSSRHPESATPRRLDLRAPDIARIYTARQIEALLAQATDPDMEEIHVRRSFQRPAAPLVWNGIAAPVWAMLHPMQAWRILAPLPQEQTASQAYQAPDATAGYLVPAALVRY